MFQQRFALNTELCSAKRGLPSPSFAAQSEFLSRRVLQSKTRQTHKNNINPTQASILHPSGTPGVKSRRLDDQKKRTAEPYGSAVHSYIQQICLRNLLTQLACAEPAGRAYDSLITLALATESADSGCLPLAKSSMSLPRHFQRSSNSMELLARWGVSRTRSF